MIRYTKVAQVFVAKLFFVGISFKLQVRVSIVHQCHPTVLSETNTVACSLINSSRLKLELAFNETSLHCSSVRWIVFHSPPRSWLITVVTLLSETKSNAQYNKCSTTKLLLTSGSKLHSYSIFVHRLKSACIIAWLKLITRAPVTQRHQSDGVRYYNNA